MNLKIGNPNQWLKPKKCYREKFKLHNNLPKHKKPWINIVKLNGVKHPSAIPLEHQQFHIAQERQLQLETHTHPTTNSNTRTTNDGNSPWTWTCYSNIQTINRKKNNHTFSNPNGDDKFLNTFHTKMRSMSSTFQIEVSNLNQRMYWTPFLQLKINHGF